MKSRAARFGKISASAIDQELYDVPTCIAECYMCGTQWTLQAHSQPAFTLCPNINCQELLTVPLAPAEEVSRGTS